MEDASQGANCKFGLPKLQLDQDNSAPKFIQPFQSAVDRQLSCTLTLSYNFRAGEAMLSARMALASGVLIIVAWGLPAHAAEQESYITRANKAIELQPMIYELDFIARFDHRIVVDTGAGGPSADDVIAGHGSLWDKKSTRIGRFDANTRLTETLENGDRRVLFVTYTFGDGQDSIVILGTGTYTGAHGLMNQQATNIFSVSGGTGKFLAAGGQCGITRLDQINYNVKCKALVPGY